MSCPSHDGTCALLHFCGLSYTVTSDRYQYSKNIENNWNRLTAILNKDNLDFGDQVDLFALAHILLKQTTKHYAEGHNDDCPQKDVLHLLNTIISMYPEFKVCASTEEAKEWANS
jgi:hypothetical protein